MQLCFMAPWQPLMQPCEVEGGKGCPIHRHLRHNSWGSFDSLPQSHFRYESYAASDMAAGLTAVHASLTAIVTD